MENILESNVSVPRSGMTRRIQSRVTATEWKKSEVEGSGVMEGFVAQVSSALGVVYRFCCGCCLPAAAESSTSPPPVQQVIIRQQYHLYIR